LKVLRTTSAKKTFASSSIHGAWLGRVVLTVATYQRLQIRRRVEAHRSDSSREISACTKGISEVNKTVNSIGSHIALRHSSACMRVHLMLHGDNLLRNVWTMLLLHAGLLA